MYEVELMAGFRVGDAQFNYNFAKDKEQTKSLTLTNTMETGKND
jgi:hypothetical protein